MVDVPDWHYVLNVNIHAAIAEDSLPTGTMVKELNPPRFQVVAPIVSTEAGKTKRSEHSREQKKRHRSTPILILYYKNSLVLLGILFQQRKISRDTTPHTLTNTEAKTTK